MKQTLLLLTIFIGLNSYSQNKFFPATCDCINQITEKSNQSEIAEQIQNCFQKSLQKHNSEIKAILKDYIAENPGTDMKFAEQNLSRILTEKLAENCSKFKEIDQALNSQKQNSKNVIKNIANEICPELRKLTNLSDKTVDPILIKITQEHQVSVYGQYNLSDREGMIKYSNDLNAELMRSCEVYKNFVVEKNSRN